LVRALSGEALVLENLPFVRGNKIKIREHRTCQVSGRESRLSKGIGVNLPANRLADIYPFPAGSAVMLIVIGDRSLTDHVLKEYLERIAGWKGRVEQPNNPNSKGEENRQNRETSRPL